MIKIYSFCYELPFFRPADEIYGTLRTPHSFLLHSPQAHQPAANYSFAGFSPFLVFTSRENKVTIEHFHENRRKKTVLKAKNPLHEMKKVMQTLGPHEEYPFPFSLGCAGFLAYELSHFFEPLPYRKLDDVKTPDMYFIFCKTVLVFSHEKNKIFAFLHVPWCEDKTKARQIADKEFSEIARRLSSGEIQHKNADTKKNEAVLATLRSSMTKSKYMQGVRKVKEYIAAGDIYQANIAQQFHADFHGDAFSFYKALVNINPSPFSAFVDGGNFCIASCSPERLVKVHGKTVETRPIAGTRPRSPLEKEDRAYADELMLNEKEKAEHLMLVDLERNDLGRVCAYGSVHVNEFMARETYSHVFHIVSNVRGRMRKNKDSFDAIVACFPGGTITGCPKIRSMEIIHEIETVRRGIYTGSIGYINANGDMDLNIAIRTAVIKNNKIYFSGGAGIVADSDPEREYYETLYKVEALVRALEKSQNIRIRNFKTKRFRPERSP